MRKAFREIDVDGDGSIDRTELRTHLAVVGKATAFSEAELTEMIKQLDENGDGKIQYEEFLALRYV